MRTGHGGDGEPDGRLRASSVTQRFDRWAPDYESSSLQQACFERLHRQVLALAGSWVPAPKRILDVGCGTGRLLRRAAARFPGSALIGLDVSAQMLARAGTLLSAGGPVSLVRGDAGRLPFADASFDVVACVACSHHWLDPGAAFAEICRVTQARGILVLAHLTGIAAWDTGDPHRHGRRRPGVVEALLRQAGFGPVTPPIRGECTVAARSVVIGVRPLRMPDSAAALRSAGCGS